ncbi:MAG: membrane-bound serine protease (ClpP class) [Bacteroidetes bacterium]|nr:MAG: membrane-bound serine protease (ClpP class) [Bacteroidota bacterium]
MKLLVKVIFSLLFVMSTAAYVFGQEAKNVSVHGTKLVKVYTFDIKEEIAPPVWRTTQRVFKNAYEIDADIMLIHMNTYGGMVDAADSIRTKILNSKIPVYVLIDNNAASAGALISIACDSIYMVAGASIGAATVVNQTGEVVPDKYQSYMRSMMRSTAEASGRNPDIAEAMVDPSIYVAGISDTGKVLTFTTSEAIKHQFCEGKAATLDEVLQKAGHFEYEIVHHQLSALDKVINFLISPVISGILIMLIVAGLYFELQTPGIGFPLGASIVAALLYFAPLYLEGLATHIEIILFVIGVVLIFLEIFAIPGFGVAGVLGILFMVTGLTLSMVESFDTTKPFEADFGPITKAFVTVIISVFAALFGSMFLGQKLLTTNRFGHLALDTVQKKQEGVTFDGFDYQSLIGQTAIAHTVLRPSGKIILNDEIYDATLQSGFANEGEEVVIYSFHTGQLFVRKV